MGDKSTLAITKEDLAILHDLAKKEKRSASAELSWLIYARKKYLELIGETASEETHDES